MKKFFVIVVLFALPLVAYLFFASGVNHFARLPVMTENLYPLEHFDNPDGEPLSFNGNITILSFPGERPEQFMVNAYHLAEPFFCFSRSGGNSGRSSRFEKRIGEGDRP